VFRGLALASEEVEQLADGGLLAGRPGQREAGLNLVAVAAACSLLGRVARLGEVGDDGAGAALGDAQGGRDVAQSCPRVAGDASRTGAWLVGSVQFSTYVRLTILE
jgi:hypothetical protein